MTVLCVVAHPDDEVLGVGGTLARHAAAGDRVVVCILSDGVTSRYDAGEQVATDEIEQRRSRAEAACNEIGVAEVSVHGFPDNQFDSMPLLDIVQAIETEIEEHDPTHVYTHHYGDLNVDHELVCRATVTATRPLPESSIESVRAFETLSSSEWSVPSVENGFQPQMYIDVSDHLEAKLEALRTYETELRDPPHPRSVDIIRQNAQVWGAKAGVPAAEPFEVLRAVHR
ncbi:PIG-L deacetylase family protein [Haloarcula sp. CGMCC 1.2071]|uniref:PIG-L deacetylase family protein n=1 Tax=Haloarcula sp. CGMCC 1.2071 TaxID=3111454 RepID=UPI00300EEE7D